MSIKDYALELNVDAKTIISKLKELGYNYNNENDILDDEAIIVLDNASCGVLPAEKNYPSTPGEKREKVSIEAE